MADLRLAPTRRKRCPSLEEAEGWIGWRVDDINGSTVGEVECLCRDLEGGLVWLVIGEDHVDGRHRYAVPAADAVGCIGRVWSPHPRRQIRTARIPGDRVDPWDEDRLLAHYAQGQRPA
jgi:hypothetical protein